MITCNLICILSYYSGVFSTGATGAIAPVILRKRLIAPAVSTHNGKILLTLSTLNIKILKTPLNYVPTEQVRRPSTMAENH